MFKRYTWTQVVIIENGKFVLLKQNNKKDSGSFWGVPEGGITSGESPEQAAIREAYEKTNLQVKLLPFRVEIPASGNDRGYKTMVTFLAHPLCGNAAIWDEPKSAGLQAFKLSDMRWQDFYDDSDLDEVTLNCIKSWRDLVNSEAFTKRAGALVYKIQNGSIYYLLISSLAVCTRFMMPQGHVEKNETSEEAAVREAKEEAGAIIALEKKLGFFIHEGKGKNFKTDIFLARFQEHCTPEENREVGWFSYEEAIKLNLHYDTKKLLDEVNFQLLNKYY